MSHVLVIAADAAGGRRPCPCTGVPLCSQVVVEAENQLVYRAEAHDDSKAKLLRACFDACGSNR